MADGSCNGLTSVFGNVNCQSAQNSAGGDLAASTTLTAYWPIFAAGGAFLLIVVLILIVLFCRARIKVDAAKRIYRNELQNLSGLKTNPPPDYV